MAEEGRVGKEGVPYYGQDKPTQEGAQGKRQRSLELPGPSKKTSKIQPSVSFAEITKDRVLLGLFDKGNPEGRRPWKVVKVVEHEGDVNQAVLVLSKESVVPIETARGTRKPSRAGAC